MLDDMIRRDWTAALEKVHSEPGCRVCRRWPVEAAHVVGRKYDTLGDDGIVRVAPDSVVPLCREHHSAYDSRLLDLLPYLTYPEQGDAARRIGLDRAFTRTCPSLNLSTSEPIANEA